MVLCLVRPNSKVKNQNEMQSSNGLAQIQCNVLVVIKPKSKYNVVVARREKYRSDFKLNQSEAQVGCYFQLLVKDRIVVAKGAKGTLFFMLVSDFK